MASGGIVQFRPTIGFAYETLPVSNTVVTLTSSTYAPAGSDRAEKALITCETADIRYRYDGGDPTASLGHLLTDGNYIVLNGINQISMFKMIRVSSDATVHVSYERE